MNEYIAYYKEYAADVADLDRKMSAEGPFPIGVVSCQLQKVFIKIRFRYSCVFQMV